MPQSLLVSDLAQLLATPFLILKHSMMPRPKQQKTWQVTKLNSPLSLGYYSSVTDTTKPKVSCLRHQPIDRIHERALRITYNDKLSSYVELLTKDISVTIHHRNIRSLVIEIYKVMQGISPPLLNEVFVPRLSNYELCGNNLLERRRV